jgi:hypothetical protein
VTDAVDDIAAGYTDARVRSFIAVLMEREVRTRLDPPLHAQNSTD